MDFERAQLTGNSGGNKARSDEIGMVVAGIDAQNTVSWLRTISGRYTPETWGSKAIALCRQSNADRIVAEANFGDEMVESTIRVVDRSAPVKLVHASAASKRVPNRLPTYTKGAVCTTAAHSSAWRTKWSLGCR